jgi:hypothetical protein
VTGFHTTAEERRLSVRWRFAGHQSVAVHEQGDGAHVHLETVPAHYGAERLLVGWPLVGGGEQGSDLREVPLETSGGDDFERPRRYITRVSEGVRYVTGLEDQVPGPGDANLLPNLGADLAL